jgi:pimeloyl-[acyl-carrier protein] methyl ester esterase
MSVLFIHGWATNKTVWPQSFTVERKHFYDFANYTDYQHLTKTFLEMCKQQEEKITLVGWSLGGMLSLQLAAEYTAKIARLILLSTTPRFTLCQSYEGGLPGSVVKNLSRKLARNPWETQKEFYQLMFSSMEENIN